MDVQKIISENFKLKEEVRRLRKLLKDNGIKDYGDYIINREERMKIFRSYFHAREDRYAFYYKGGYHPACYNRNKGKCYIVKGKKKCSLCNNASFIPLSDDVIKKHTSSSNNKIGIYPLFPDHTCYFIAIDFDEDDWFDAILASYRVAKRHGIESVMERSSSGNGGHLWFFFKDKVYASNARKMVLFFLNEAMKINRRITFKSFDRIFPNQDLMPEGGFGNLIALPFQYNAIQEGSNTLFIDEEGEVITKQFHYLNTITKITFDRLEELLNKNIEPDILNEPIIENIDKNISEMQIVEDSMLHIYKLNLNARTIHSIRKSATIWNNQYFLFQRMHKPIFSKNTPMTLSEYEETDTYINVPRGLKLEIEKSFLNTIKLKENTILGNVIDVGFKGKLYSYQEKVINKALKRDMGIIIAPTGSGKTVMALYMIAKMQRSTLIVLENKQLLRQWIDRINQFLEYPVAKLKRDNYIGEFSGSKKKLKGNIDVALIQSLANIEDVAVFDNYGVVIIDECHHSANATYRYVLKQLKAKNIYSFTATPQRADGQDKIINMYLGDIIAKVDNKDIEQYRNYQQLLIPRFTTFSTFDDTSSFIMILDMLIKNEKRNRQITKDVIKEFRNSKNCIILSERIEHLNILYQNLKYVDQNIYILSGKTKKKDKNNIIEKLKLSTKENYILIASSKLLGEGFDLPNLEVMFMATPFAWKGRTKQYAGRLHRSNEGKTIVKVYDYIDQNIEILNKMYRKRLVVYKKEGYDIQIDNQEMVIDKHLYDNNTYQKQISIDMLNSKQEILICCDKVSISVIKKKYKFLQEVIYSGVSLYIFIYDKGEYNQDCINYLEGLGAKVQLMKIRSKCIIIDKSIIWIPTEGYLSTEGKNNSACRLNSIKDTEEIYLDIKENSIKG